MITPANQAAQYTKTKLEARRNSIKALARDYFNKNIKQIEARFNKELVENSYIREYGDVGYHKKPTIYSFYFSWPYEWRDISYELKNALYELLEEHVRKYGYYTDRKMGIQIGDGRIFEYQAEAK